jgi:hypothetical protein
VFLGHRSCPSVAGSASKAIYRPNLRWPGRLGLPADLRLAGGHDADHDHTSWGRITVSGSLLEERYERLDNGADRICPFAETVAADVEQARWGLDLTALRGRHPPSG